MALKKSKNCKLNFVYFLVLTGFLFEQTCASQGPVQAKIEALDEENFQLTVKFTVNGLNDGVTGFCVLKWNTMMDDEYWAANIDIRSKNTPSKEDPYARLVLPLRSEIRSSDYKFLPLGTQMKFTRDLAEHFSIRRNVNYVLTFRHTFMDYYKVSNGICNENVAEEWTKYKQNGVTLSFKTGKDFSPYDEGISISEWLIHTPEWNGQKDGNVVTTATKSAQYDHHRIIIEAFNQAKDYVNTAYNHLDHNNHNDYLFQKWFVDEQKSSNDQSKSKAIYKILKQNFYKIKTDFYAHNRLVFYHVLPKDLCKPLTYAVFPFPGKMFFYICPLFFQDEEEKAITLVHEMSHYSADTDDICYGKKFICRDLVRENKTKAVRNADSYAYFAEDVWNANLNYKNLNMLYAIVGTIAFIAFPWLYRRMQQ